MAERRCGRATNCWEEQSLGKAKRRCAAAETRKRVRCTVAHPKQPGRRATVMPFGLREGRGESGEVRHGVDCGGGAVVGTEHVHIDQVLVYTCHGPLPETETVELEQHHNSRLKERPNPPSSTQRGSLS